MRILTLITGLSFLIPSAWSQERSLTPQAQIEARMWDPGSSFFYINGIAYRYAAASSYAVVAAATTGIAGKYLGVKVHIFNRSRQSITVRPEDIAVVDAVGNRRLEPIPAIEIANRKRGQPGWMRFASSAVAGAPEPMGDLVNPQWNELIRALQPEVTSSARADSTTAVYSSQRGPGGWPGLRHRMPIAQS